MQDTARIAVYDDLLSAPRVVDVPPQGVHDFIESIASTTYELSHQQGGVLPYTVIREITENFIHAGFLECTVSILDEGNTLRFADQGPGILKKDLVLQPGVSSATHKMKDYIRGVGSGFPIVREYLSSSHGFMNIDDNAEDGVVVTISLAVDTPSASQNVATQSHTPVVETTKTSIGTPDVDPYPVLTSSTPSNETRTVLDVDLSNREERALLLLSEQGILGPVDMAEHLGISAPTATRLLQRLELLGMVESTQLKKRILSNAGMTYVQELLVSGNLH